MKLLALRCPQCEQPLTPENDHIITLCDHCYTAIHIGDEGLAPISIRYASPVAGAKITRWSPFWIFKGRVHILQRQTQGGHSERESKLLWDKPRSLYVPAWELSMATAQNVGSLMIEQQPIYQVGPQPAKIQLVPITVTAADALKLLEFIVLAIETRRSDWLKKLDFRLEVDQPELWALPADDSKFVAIED